MGSGGGRSFTGMKGLGVRVGVGEVHHVRRSTGANNKVNGLRYEEACYLSDMLVMLL